MLEMRRDLCERVGKKGAALQTLALGQQRQLDSDMYVTAIYYSLFHSRIKTAVFLVFAGRSC
jgi:hypothetical protein